MDEADGSFVAVFLYPDDAAESVSRRLPIVGAGPPVVIRVAAAFEGAAAVDVFRLVDASAWPEAAAYLYEGTVPGIVADDHGVEQVTTPDD